MPTFTIKEFSKITGISAHNLRFFDNIGLLKPRRDDNGYRIYLLPQIAIAKMILILQQAAVPNKDIAYIIDYYCDPSVIDKLEKYKCNIMELIEKLQYSFGYLENHISDLHYIHDAKSKLGQPFIEDLDERVLGVLSLNTPDILDFFDQTGMLCGDEGWYLSNHYGFIVKKDEVHLHSYPLKVMYSYLPLMISREKSIFPAGRYMSMFCKGSLEDNKKVFWLVNYARSCCYDVHDDIYVENVTGPVLEKDKPDFVIKIMIKI